MPTFGPFALPDTATLSISSRDGDRLSLRLDEARRSTVAGKRVNGGEDPFNKLSSVTEEDVDIVRRRYRLKAIIDMTVSNVMTLIHDRIIFALKFCTPESRPISIRAAVLIMIATPISEQDGVKCVVRPA